MATTAKSSPANARTKVIPPSARRVRGGLKCPECDFVARHAMGLGRHRSARHGVTSRRSAIRGTSGRWLTRLQAAERANVHYNTIRQWEHAGLVKTTKRPGVRGLLLSADDLERFLVERGGYQAAPSSEASDAAIRALQQRYDRLIGDLERLLDAAKSARPTLDGTAAGSTRAKGTRAKGKRRAGKAARRTTSSAKGKRGARSKARAATRGRARSKGRATPKGRARPKARGRTPRRRAARR